MLNTKTMRNSDLTSERLLVMTEKPPVKTKKTQINTEKPPVNSEKPPVSSEKTPVNAEKVKAAVTTLENSKNADNTKVYHCVLCEEKFTEHHLMIEHFR